MMNTQSTPREANSDYGKDGKRKVVNLDGAGELRAVNTQPVWPNRNQASSKGNRSELAFTKSETRKPYQGKFSLDRGGVSNSSRWDKATWPINPPLHVNSPSEDKLLLLSLNFQFGAGSKENGSPSEEVGNLPRRESYSSRRQHKRGDSERPNRHHGVIRSGGNGGVEKHIPFNGGKCSTGLSSDGGQSMDHHTEPILEFPHGQAKIPTPSKHSLSSSREAIMDAPLRKISVCSRKNSSGTSDCSEEISPGKTHRDGGNGKSICNQAPPILNADNCMHTGYPQQPSSNGDSETCCEPHSRCIEGDDRAKASMDIKGDRGGSIPEMF